MIQMSMNDVLYAALGSLRADIPTVGLMPPSELFRRSVTVCPMSVCVSHSEKWNGRTERP